MFDYSKMIKRAIEFFPRWTDIRKRYATSNGGNLISTMLDESLKIEDAINEYINSYFLETYEGHENEVMAFSYIAKIGRLKETNKIDLRYNNSILMLTEDLKTFENELYKNYAYYEDGIIHIKESAYVENEILYVSIDDVESEYRLEKHHIWNIFDEFATFVNTRRYENETNKELLDRILYITKHLPNGTEEGLKHAIVSEIMRFDPNISIDDIKIERATPKNLIKPYEDYESLLEKLMYINRDVFKCKRWDFDYWKYDFESISYIPHKWNESLTVWQNGVGSMDDLEVIISDSNIDPTMTPTTDAKLTLYNKSLKTFEKYVQNKDIPYNVEFKLTKYNNILNKANIKYRIKASEVLDITNENIELCLYESNEVEEIINIEDVYSFGRNIKIQDNSVYPASDLNWYRLKFVQRSDQDFKITRAQVRYSNEKSGQIVEVTNLVKPQSGFIYNAEYELVSAKNSKAINRIEDFNICSDLMNTPSGITLAENATIGSAVLAIDKYAGMYMTVDAYCEPVPVPESLIRSKGSYWRDGESGYREFVLRGEYSIEEKMTTMEVTANTFSFKVGENLTGRTSITCTDDGIEQDTIFLKSGDVFSVKETSEPRKIKIVINVLSFNDVVLYDFKYSSYVIDVSTKLGLTSLGNGKYRLPINSNGSNNSLTILLKTTTGKKPYIRRISIGESLDEAVYITDYIATQSNCSRKFDIKANADIYLLKYIPLDDDMIAEIVAEAQGTFRRLLLKEIKDDVINFITEQKFYKSYSAEDYALFEESLMNGIIDIIRDEAYKSLDLKSVLSMYQNKLIQRANHITELTEAITNKIDVFLTHRFENMIDLGSYGKFTLKDICKYLVAPNLQLEDKIEWHSLAMNFANELLDICIEMCTKDLGKFNPKSIYIGNHATEDCYIRLDLSEYESIETITPDGGVAEIDEISESGNVYYNIKLNNGASVSTIKIKGIRNKEARVIPLHDMIKFHIDDFDVTNDRILCSRLMDSVIISRTNKGGTPYNMLIKLGSDMTAGILATKYQLKLPEYIGSRYGTHTLSSNESSVHYQSFDYISFFPAEGQIYEAVNEYNSYMEENRNIKIVNNFAPDLDLRKQLVYTVENLNKNDKEKHIIRFQDDAFPDKSIYELDTWCIGQHDITIYNTIDLNNDISYSVNTYDVNTKELLSTMIDIKDSYKITDAMILDTTQYIIEPPEGLTVKFEEYNGSEAKAHLLKTEIIVVDENRFNKLTYANIDGLFHLSTNNPDDGYEKTNKAFDLLEKQGIIIWGNDVAVGTRFHVVYSIKKPVGFLLALDDLYKAINYDIEAYNRLDTIILSNLESGATYEYSKIDNIDEVDLIHIECTDPCFKGIIDNSKEYIEFVKYINNKNILIKTGYYYVDGREYYLYSEDEKEKIANNEYYSSENIDVSAGEILTYKPTNNFVANTEMRLKGKASIYNYDCQEDLSYGISRLNALTACNSYNNWTYFETVPTLVAGVNGLAMKFDPKLDCSYSYLDITDALSDEETNYISLIASSNLKIFIGEEEPYLDIKFSRTLNMVLKEEIVNTGSDIRMATITKAPNERYYLVVQGEGVLDDIIITTNKNDSLYGHNKNISLLGLDLTETKIQGTEYRMSIDDNKDYTPYEAAMMSNGYFKTTSKIDWYITEVASFQKENDFYSCILDNVDVTRSYMSTNMVGGTLITPPIYINNKSTIKKLIFKINDIELEQMQGFNTIAYTSSSYDGDYIALPGGKDNKFYILGDDLMEYVKFKIEIPANKIITNIEVFVEYKSSEENVLILPLHESGYIESKIYDLQETMDYRLKDLGIEDISNINDIELYIRASRDIDKLEVWHNWQRIGIKEDLTLGRYIKFYDVRFMQLKIVLKTRKSYIKFNHLDVEVI